jgi:hypothetical protein
MGIGGTEIDDGELDGAWPWCWRFLFLFLNKNNNNNFYFLIKKMEI